MMDRLVTAAPINTPCGWKALSETGTKLTCEAGREAVHILTATLPVAPEGTALCAFHSPYDVTPADRLAMVEASKSGIDVLRELLTLEPVKKVKVAVVHYVPADAKPYSDGQITMADGKTMPQARGTSVLANVTCKGCKRSRAFDMAEYREYLAAAQAEEQAPITEAEAEAIEADRAGVMVGQIILVGKYELANVTFASTSKVCAQGDHQTYVWDEDSWADALSSRAVTVFDEADVAEMLVEARAEGYNTVELWLHAQAVEEARRPVAKSAKPRLA